MERIAIIGNGGSCSTAEHLACDLRSKGKDAEALTNSSIITQIGNDKGFKYIFSEQLKMKNFDDLIVISVSGNSPNIIEALKIAKEKGISTLGLLGFDGGKALKLVNNYFLVKNKNYEYVEDKHIQFLHNIKRKKTIWTDGCFDIIHAGHVDYLQKAGRLGFMIVGITSDKSVRKEKGKLIIPQNERAKIIQSIEGVDEVIIVDNTAKVLKTVKPDIYVKGGDYNINTINQEERKIVESYGGEIMIIPLVEKTSSTKIISKIKENKRK